MAWSNASCQLHTSPGLVQESPRWPALTLKAPLPLQPASAACRAGYGTPTAGSTPCSQCNKGFFSPGGNATAPKPLCQAW